MKRLACILCLLSPLAMGAAAPEKPVPPAPIAMNSAHAPAPNAVFSDHAGGKGSLPPANIGRAAARLLAQSGWPGPAPARASLAGADLSRHVRLALVERPEWAPDPLGHTRLNVGIIGLRW